MPRKSINSVARDFATYAAETLLRDLRGDPEILAKSQKLYGFPSGTDAETIVRAVFEHLAVEIDEDGRIRVFLPKRKRSRS